MTILLCDNYNDIKVGLERQDIMVCTGKLIEMRYSANNTAGGKFKNGVEKRTNCIQVW